MNIPDPQRGDSKPEAIDDETLSLPLPVFHLEVYIKNVWRVASFPGDVIAETLPRRVSFLGGKVRGRPRDFFSRSTRSSILSLSLSLSLLFTFPE